MRARWLRRAFATGLALGAATVAAFAPTTARAEGWCVDELTVLEGDVCWAPGPSVAPPTGAPPSAPSPTPPSSKGGASPARRTLVVFLHGLTDEGSGWQHAMQRGMAAAGKRFGFAMLAPRGRNGVGPGKRPDQIAWPTSESSRAAFEDDVLAKIVRARIAAEAREGAPYDEVFVMGFSNGAYYAASLAMRGRLADVDGYAIIAGGSAATRPTATGAARKPVFVGVASKDPTTVKKGRELVRSLRRLDWPHRAVEAPVGHTVADSHLSLGLRWLRERAARGAAASVSEESAAPSSAQPPANAEAPAPRANAPKVPPKPPASRRTAKKRSTAKR